jgi:hypothetical protein
VAVKRVVDYNVKVRVKSDGTGVDIHTSIGGRRLGIEARQSSRRL